MKKWEKISIISIFILCILAILLCIYLLLNYNYKKTLDMKIGNYKNKIQGTWYANYFFSPMSERSFEKINYLPSKYIHILEINRNDIKEYSYPYRKNDYKKYNNYTIDLDSNMINFDDTLCEFYDKLNLLKCEDIVYSKEDIINNLVFDINKWEIENKKAKCIGSIKNIGKYAYKRIKVVIAYYNENGSEISSDEIEIPRLEPNKEYEIRSVKNEYILNWKDPWIVKDKKIYVSRAEIEIE